MRSKQTLSGEVSTTPPLLGTYVHAKPARMRNLQFVLLFRRPMLYLFFGHRRGFNRLLLLLALVGIHPTFSIDRVKL